MNSNKIEQDISNQLVNKNNEDTNTISSDNEINQIVENSESNWQTLARELLEIKIDQKIIDLEERQTYLEKNSQKKEQTMTILVEALQKLIDAENENKAINITPKSQETETNNN